MGLSASDEAAWRRFDDRYRPIALAVASRLGLADADAADAAQETMLHFLRSFRDGAYQRERGRLRQWVAGIARHRVIDAARAAAARRERQGDSSQLDQATEDDSSRFWEEESARETLRRAAERLHQSTRLGEKSLRAFDLLFARSIPPAGVAAELAMPLGEVYVIKSRLAEHLRELIGEEEALADAG